MKVFVTGVGGQLGYDVVNELLKRGYEVVGSDVKDCEDSLCEYIKLDITEKEQVEATILSISPDVVIHCAAWTAVDSAEDENVFPIVNKINVDGTKNIALACKKINCKMLYISTDYVFDGQGEIPWTPDCQDFNPLNVYGKSKLGGEIAVKELLDEVFEEFCRVLEEDELADEAMSLEPDND